MGNPRRGVKNTNKRFKIKVFLVEKTVFHEFDFFPTKIIDISPKKADTDKQCRAIV